ncbi:MAG: hypothetical protein HZC16_00990 [Candidatus Omnitrophica bacterium]|nr:hypothetical protein [Candidatus Omnitrophota bacterium]
MEKKGLCTTCVEFKTCIFSKEPPVWQCEEFSNGNNVPASFKQIKTKRVVSREVATESE